MDNDELTWSEFADEKNTLALHLEPDKIAECIVAMYAAKEFFNDFSELKEEKTLSLKQCYIEKALYINSLLLHVVIEGDKARKNLEDVVPFDPKDYTDGGDLSIYSPGPPDKFIATLKRILNKDYRPSEDVFSLMEDLHCISFAYLCGGGEVFIPPSANYRLDLAAFRLICGAGSILPEWKNYPNKLRHRLKTKAGKKNQASKTIDKILKAYKSLGVQWLDNSEKKPFSLNGKKITINKLSGEIFLQLKGEFTQRHINNYLKELREKGEI